MDVSDWFFGRSPGGKPPDAGVFMDKTCIMLWGRDQTVFTAFSHRFHDACFLSKHTGCQDADQN